MTETLLEIRPLGYARASTYGPTHDPQLDQLRAVVRAKIYQEKASGARAYRRELQRLLKDLLPGALVTVTRIDRLARSTFDLFAIVKRIVDVGGQFRSLAEPWADTAATNVLGGLADGVRQPHLRQPQGGQRCRYRRHPERRAWRPLRRRHRQVAIAVDVLQETGIRVQALALWENEMNKPELFSNLARIENIKREGLRL